MTGLAKNQRARKAGRSFAAALIVGALTSTSLQAAQPPQGPPPTPRAIAPSDYTGVWVSVVTEDWRWRMTTAPRSDFLSVPLNANGQKVAGEWDQAADRTNGNECKAFGAAGLMRLPMRMRVSWQGDTTLKLETDAGQQVRLFQFGGAPAATAAPSWQGYSAAEWIKQAQARGIGGGGRAGPVAGGRLKVVTTQLRAGYLRKNGIPYSDKAVLTEYFVRTQGADGQEYLTVISRVEDPTYLTQPFVTSTDFKREANDSKWNATGCVVDPPRT